MHWNLHNCQYRALIVSLHRKPPLANGEEDHVEIIIIAPQGRWTPYLPVRSTLPKLLCSPHVRTIRNGHPENLLVVRLQVYHTNKKPPKHTFYTNTISYGFRRSWAIIKQFPPVPWDWKHIVFSVHKWRRKYTVSSNRCDLAHIKKDRLSTRFLAAIFKVVAAVQYGNVPRTVWYWNLHRPTYAKSNSRDYHVTCGVRNKSGLSRSECKSVISA